jgi:hypothetical protein
MLRKVNIHAAAECEADGALAVRSADRGGIHHVAKEALLIVTTSARRMVRGVITSAKFTKVSKVSKKHSPNATKGKVGSKPL